MSIAWTLCVITLASWTSSEAAEPSDELAPEPAPTVAETDREPWLQHLVEAQDWTGLRTEALRWSFETDDPAMRARARYYEAWAMLKGGDERGAVLRFIALEDESPQRWSRAASLAAARAWRDLEPALAVARYERLLAAPTSPAMQEEARLGLAWTSARLGRFDQALAALPPPVDPELERLLTRPGWRRAGWAAVMSAVVPGAGQLYAGAPKESLAAFLVVGGLGAGTAVLAARGEEGAAVAVGVLAGSFYFGNVYGAADAATRANRRRRMEATARIGALEAPEWPGLGGR